jgi:hypothetical protein
MCHIITMTCACALLRYQHPICKLLNLLLPLICTVWEYPFAAPQVQQPYLQFRASLLLLLLPPAPP